MRFINFLYKWLLFNICLVNSRIMRFVDFFPISMVATPMAILFNVSHAFAVPFFICAGVDSDFYFLITIISLNVFQNLRV